ncbi:MAG: MSMEG_1061 family FMN-dependent PPOX-type flavoprotein [Dermatophilaceae bacterium]
MEERVITTSQELVGLIGEPAPRARDKVRPSLDDADRRWLAASRMCLIATSDATGRCDVSPKGDPAGSLVHVLDHVTIAIAERPGNRRVDGYHNILANPHAGLIFLVPGRSDTLRVNGRARLVADAPWFDALVVRGARPVLALVVEIEEVFGHCAKSLIRGEVWHPETWNPGAVLEVGATARARRAQGFADEPEPGATVTEVEEGQLAAYGIVGGVGLY